MKKIPKDPNWHYLKWFGIAVASILLFGIINNVDRSLSVLTTVLHVLSPIFIGIFIAIILNIPVSLFENKIFGKLTRRNGKIWSKIKRLVSIVLSLTLFFLIITVLLSYVIPEFIRTCQSFIEKADKYTESLVETLRGWIIRFNLPIDPESVSFTWENVTTKLVSLLGDNSDDILDKTMSVAIALFSSVWNVILGFIFAIYIIASKDSLSKLVKGLLYAITSREKGDRVVSITTLAHKAFEGFILGQCIEVLLIGSFTFIGMCIFRFPHKIMISCIIAVTAFVPIFGAIIGAIIGAALIFLVDPFKALWFLIFIIVLQQIESNFIYPKIMGQQVGLPSLWVLTAVILGGEFFGIPGIIISVPLASVVYVLLHEWILKRLKEKKLCKQASEHIPEEPTPLSDEEFLAPEPEPKTEPKKEKSKKDSSKVKVTQKSTSKKKKKGKRSKK